MEAPLPRMEDKTGKEAAVAELVLHDEEVEEEVDECRCVRPLVVGIAGASRSGKTTLALGLLGALGGPTPAPNSTTSLFESFDPRTIVHLDRYFKSPREMEKKRVGGRTVANWELASSLRWDEFVAALRRQIERKTLVCARCARLAESQQLQTATTASPSSPRTPRSRGNSVGGGSAPSSPLTPRFRAASAAAPEVASAGSKPKRKLIIVEGFLLFTDKEVVSLIDKHIFITVNRSTSRQRRTETMGTPGWYFDRVIWPCYLKHNRAVLEMPQQLLVVDGHTEKHEVVRAAVDFIEGRPVDDALQRAHLSRVLHEALPPALLGWF
ncbi:uncharacterized protein ACA1_071960 [Acanthamoeba castellanii str. Neff]|uniref:Nicotinamide riboside kinase n=1 Tax=Acanthamoeba castellanii (strain ATCC 30010 / Neff) TaxID=1257118 RepID=L8HDI6_ACACF|nr:uncharacterized protein ACA1_071960 [Acanthamoeba castellanii str. Neff]ELR23574.1 hypothetical protein ACA1_071960 [Acanthamoeba castellanii str. Neff]